MLQFKRAIIASGAVGAKQAEDIHLLDLKRDIVDRRQVTIFLIRP